MRRLTVVTAIGVLSAFRCAVPLFGSCQIDAEVTKGTVRMSGNLMRGYSVAWAGSGDWWNWSATVYGRLIFLPTQGSSSVQDQGSNSGPLSWDDDEDPGNPRWTGQAQLDGNGNGGYYVQGYADFYCNWGQYYPGVGNGISPSQSVTRPVISPPENTYGSDRWAFWYLNGEPSIDGFYVTADLSANDGMSGSNYSGPTPNYDWGGVDKPGKISFETLGGTETLVTSLAASDSLSFDVGIKFYVDGFSSDEFWLHINTPKSLTNDGAMSTTKGCDGSGTPGYSTDVDYYGADMWGNRLYPITVNETHGNSATPGSNPPTVGWPWPVSADVWPAPAWRSVGGYSVFTDSIWARDCSNTWRPLPVPPQQLDSSVMSAPQGLFVGSSTNGRGVSVLTPTQTWYTDHGSAQ